MVTRPTSHRISLSLLTTAIKNNEIDFVGGMWGEKRLDKCILTCVDLINRKNVISLCLQNGLNPLGNRMSGENLLNKFIKIVQHNDNDTEEIVLKRCY